MFRRFAIAAAFAVAAAAPAAAATVDISQSANFSSTTFNLFEQTVVLPVGFTDALIHIGSVFANDAAVLQVNGTNIVGWGIFGPGQGSFAFSASGPFEPFTFALGHGFGAVTVNQSFNAPFVAGANTIKLFHNDNGNGITGGQFSLDSGSVLLSANITYTAAPVPEPAAWSMLLAGVGILGALARRRKTLRH